MKTSNDLAYVQSLPDERRPKHIAVIMDGNGRWAQGRGMPRFEGHRRGARAVRDVMSACQKAGVRHLTLYCFSSENWKRPQKELDFLMDLLRTYLIRERSNFVKNGIRLRVIGDRNGLPPDIVDELNQTIEASKDGEFELCLAINYGSRDEILNSVKAVARRVLSNEISLDEVDEAEFESHLYTAGMPDPDLLIRTSGEYRISNYMLWQISYTELWITDKHWPEFAAEDLYLAICDYSRRNRRYGGLQRHNASS